MGEVHKAGCVCERCEKVRARDADAARYRWLRQRLEVCTKEAMNGTKRPALEIRLGRAFLDSKVRPRIGDVCIADSLDAAIDAAKAGEPHGEA